MVWAEVIEQHRGGWDGFVWDLNDDSNKLKRPEEMCFCLKIALELR